jgi:hypothetical protein
MCLQAFIAHIARLEPVGMFPVDNHESSAAFDLSAPVGTTTNFSNHNWLAIRKVALEPFAVVSPILFAPVIVNADEVEEIPVYFFNWR